MKQKVKKRRKKKNVKEKDSNKVIRGNHGDKTIINPRKDRTDDYHWNDKKTCKSLDLHVFWNVVKISNIRLCYHRNNNRLII